jgi:transposase
MDNVTHLGLDVHKDSIALGLLRPGREVPDHRVINNTPEAIRKLVSRLDVTSLIACYEARPTGYDTYRLLDSLGVRCDVIAPALIPRRAGRRIKTDRLDARNLARLHRAGELTPIRVPSRSEEALRDLIRVREDLKDDRRRAQQRIKGFLLRQGRRFPGNAKGWSAKFDTWVRAQRFDDGAAQLAFDHYLQARTARTVQLTAIDSEIEAAVTAPPLAEPVAHLRCLRGVDTLSAATIAAEVCDFRRFRDAASFMAFTGLVPSEHSSGLANTADPSPRPATVISGGCWSRPRGPTDTALTSAPASPAATRDNPTRSWPTAITLRCGSTPATGVWSRPVIRASPWSRSRANSPGSCGRS